MEEKPQTPGQSDRPLSNTGQGTQGAGSKGRGKRRRRRKDHHFMDAALDGFIRDVALRLWRDFEVYRSKPDADRGQALVDTGFFEDRQPYAGLWSGHWTRTVVATGASTADGDLYGVMEAAVRAAVLEEREARKAATDAPLEDLEDYNEFIRRTLNKLLVEDPADRQDRQ